MKFDAFDKTEQARFAAEVKEKWGGTAAYQEYQQREKDGSAGDFAELMAQFTELGKLKNLAPAAPETQAAIRKLQQFITDHFYTCTPKILAELGEMHTAVAVDAVHPTVYEVRRGLLPAFSVIAKEGVELAPGGFDDLCNVVVTIAPAQLKPFKITFTLGARGAAPEMFSVGFSADVLQGLVQRLAIGRTSTADIWEVHPS